jgi:serine/threonine protein kinase/tetratricopeptide (TPR) repeat protein
MRDESERDELVMTLVEAALEQSPENGESYLRAACGGEADLYAEVTERVEWERRMSGFLTRSLISTFQLLDRPFEPGELVADRFRILNEAGRGGMGVVYEAFDEKLNRRVAIKSAQGGYGHWLPPEVRAAREVSHFNVCKVHDLHSTTTDLGEVQFLSMEFIEGETLAARLGRAGALQPDEAMEIALQICAGLTQAHRQDVIHGDLKCANVILTKTPGGAARAVITDFGLAAMKLPGEERTLQQPGGSVDYMAPELFTDSPVSVASDLYALGVLFHFMLTGEPPAPVQQPRLPQDAQTVIREQAQFGAYTPRRPKALPAPWGGIVKRCLEPSPTKRFSSVAEVAERLKEGDRVRKWIPAAAMAAILVVGLWLLRVHPVDPHSRAAIPIRSVAVIPFANAPSAVENQYLSDGISEGLIDALAQLPDLKVIARSSSFRFKADRIDIRTVARALGVHALVTGRVAAIDRGLRITVELVNGADGTQLWGAQYNSGMADLAVTQAEICRQVGEHIRSEVTLADREKLSRGAKANPEAYALLLRGRYQIRLYTPESRKKAVGYYEEALAIDPGFALANAELAAAYRLLSGSGILSGADALPKAEAAVRRALAADESLAEAHAAFADIRKDQWDFATAEREYRRALQLSPNLVEAHEGLAICLTVLGRYDAAVAEVQSVLELDPINVQATIDTAAVYYNARRFEPSLAALRRGIERDPASPSLWSWAGMVHGANRQFIEAIASYQKAINLGDNTEATQGYYAYALAQSGHRQQARQILRRLQQSHEFVPATTLAIAFAGLGEKERAIQLLQNSLASRDPLLQYILVEPHFDLLKDDPRFRDLAAQVGLPR